MNLAMHKSCDGGIHQPMALNRGTPAKRRAHETHAKMATLASAGMSGVGGAVVADIKRKGGERLFERRA